MAKKIKKWSLYGKQGNYDKRSKEYKIYNGVNRERQRLIGPITRGQAIQQSRFGLVNKTVAQFKEIRAIALQYKSIKARAAATMFHHIYNETLVGDFPHFYINYASVTIAPKHYISVFDLNVTIKENGLCSIIWEDDQFNEEPFGTKEPSLIVFVLNATKNSSVVYVNVTHTNERYIELLAPDHTDQDKIHLWIFLNHKLKRAVFQCGYASAI
jgi:hypothetical protein